MNKWIKQKVIEEFKDSEHDLVINLLAKIHLNDVWNSAADLDSTQESILILAKGSVHRVRSLVKSAKVDFRDVVAAASTDPAVKPKLP
ncbi:hypothetical protein FLL45_15355 [Aliikangiella marina]|uniref:Uncharacterized protein n=1 Tax=Aliikangiella marina TaxID=1712262 RepID=A0A545T6J0_9GAMM|nr:hypothetical protein [Aliikangiella marina]TQV72841.1 hypothetical protein FLL45_15355 [Aliikangiella marina]